MTFRANFENFTVRHNSLSGSIHTHHLASLWLPLAHHWEFLSVEWSGPECTAFSFITYLEYVMRFLLGLILWLHSHISHDIMSHSCRHRLCQICHELIRSHKGKATYTYCTWLLFKTRKSRPFENIIELKLYLIIYQRCSWDSWYCLACMMLFVKRQISLVVWCRCMVYNSAIEIEMKAFQNGWHSISIDKGFTSMD